MLMKLTEVETDPQRALGGKMQLAVRKEKGREMDREENDKSQTFICLNVCLCESGRLKVTKSDVEKDRHWDRNRHRY